jgi:hypothetical protein
MPRRRNDQQKNRDPLIEKFNLVGIKNGRSPKHSIYGERGGLVGDGGKHGNRACVALAQHVTDQKILEILVCHVLQPEKRVVCVGAWRWGAMGNRNLRFSRVSAKGLPRYSYYAYVLTRGLCLVHWASDNIKGKVEVLYKHISGHFFAAALCLFADSPALPSATRFFPIFEGPATGSSDAPTPPTCLAFEAASNLLAFAAAIFTPRAATLFFFLGFARPFLAFSSLARASRAFASFALASSAFFSSACTFAARWELEVVGGFDLWEIAFWAISRRILLHSIVLTDL